MTANIIHTNQFPGIIVREALLAGQIPPALSKAFVYADLSPGSGATLGLLAASFPESQFYGIGDADNPDNLANLNFAEDISAIPDSNFVVLRGLHADVAAALGAAHDKLKPGGLLHLTADLSTGAAETASLRVLFRHALKQHDGDTGAALTLAATMARADAPLKRDNLKIAGAVDSWETRCADDVAAHLLLPCNPHSIGDIIKTAQAQGLHCCGPLEQHSPTGKSLATHFAAGVTDEAILEDYFSALKTEPTRSLIFVKPTEDFTRSNLALRGADIVGFDVPTLWSDAVEPPVEPLSAWAAEQDHEPLCLGTALMQVAAEALRGDDVDQIGKMIGEALTKRTATLYAKDTSEVALTAETAITAVHPQTTRLLDLPRTYRFGVHLPSPVLGGGVYLSPAQAALLSAALSGASDKAAHAEELIADMDAKAPAFALAPAERASANPRRELEDFESNWLPFLGRIGVIEALST